MRASTALLLLPLALTAADTFPLTSTQDLIAHNMKIDAVEYKGRKAVRLMPDAPGEGAVFLRGAEFEDGAIEADVAVKLTTPPGVRNPGFIGIAFRARPDARYYDMFYIRPGNSNAEDQAMRNHAVQYVQGPDYGWERLRRSWPSVYEASANLQLESWIHMRIEVEGRRAKLYVNGETRPALVVDGLKGEDLKGGVGLWGFPGQESYFSNVRISPAKRQPVENGGDPAGTWELKYASDAGPHPCTLNLHRDGDKLSGTLTGLLGPDVPVSGTWRNGYIELTFHGTWPDPNGGDASALLAGWVDGNSSRGRMIVTGRADGVWTATRKAE
jgi:hypothetical protein